MVYCSKECQSKDWPVHKRDCAPNAHCDRSEAFSNPSRGTAQLVDSKLELEPAPAPELERSSDEDPLVHAVRQIVQSQPSIGVKKVVGVVKLNFPSLSCGAKEVRMALQGLKRQAAEHDLRSL